MKSQLLTELKKTWIPNFELFKSSEDLKVIPDLLNELLSKERADFEKILEKNAENLTFDELFIEGELGYLRNILNFLNSTEKSPEIRKIIQDFRAKYEDFFNQIIMRFFLISQREIILMLIKSEFLSLRSSILSREGLT